MLGGADEMLFGDRQHSAGASGGVVDRSDDAGLSQGLVVLGEQQVHHQPDRVPRGEVLTSGLVRGLGELSDQVLEEVPHVGVGDRLWVEVDLGELGHDQVQPPLLVQGGDLVVELEPFEHVDVGREPVGVLDQVGAEPVGVGFQPGHVVLGGVVEGKPMLGLQRLREQGLRRCPARSVIGPHHVSAPGCSPVAAGS